MDTLDAPLDPANANRYAYAANDPINNADPLGLATTEKLFGELIGTAVGAGFGALVTAAAAPLGGWAPIIGGAVGGCVGGIVSGGTTASLKDEEYSGAEAAKDCGVDSALGAIGGINK